MSLRFAPHPVSGAVQGDAAFLSGEFLAARSLKG